MVLVEQLIGKESVKMVQFLLHESRLGSRGNINFRRRTWVLLGLLLGESRLLNFDCLFFAGNFLRSGRLRVGADDLVWQAFELDLLNAHLSAIFKVQPELGVANRSVLYKTLLWIVFIADWLISFSCKDFLFNLVIGAITRSQTKLQVVLDHNRLGESLATNREMIHAHDRVVVRVEKQ